MIKKIAAVVLLLNACSVHALAKAPQNKYYAGGGLELNFQNYHSSLKNNPGVSGFPKATLTGVEVFAGYRWNLIAAEIGVQDLRIETFNIGPNSNDSLDQKGSNYYLDGLYYYSLAQNFNLKALLGVGYLTTKFNANAVGVGNNGLIYYGAPNNSKSRVGVRVGAGAEYYFSKPISVGLLYSFQTGNSFSTNLQTIALSLAYHFKL